MVETLLTPSTIKLYGRVLGDLKYAYDTASVVTGVNHFLQSQLATGVPFPITGVATTTNNIITNTQGNLSNIQPGMTVTATDSTGNNQIFAANTTILSLGPAPNSFTVSAIPISNNGGQPVNITAQIAYTEPNFARIYAFTFEGAIYNLPRPSIFLVHGAGASLDFTFSAAERSTMEQSGVIAREWEFAASQPSAAGTPPGNSADLRYWEYEKSDLSIRLDPEAGPFEQILLAAALRGGADTADRATGIRSGMGLENRSGMGVSGMGVSGMGVSGMGLRNGR